MYGAGVMFNISKKGKDEWKCDLVTWDGNLNKDYKITCDDISWYNQGVYDLR